MVCEGNHIRFWYDPWSDQLPLKDLYPDLFDCHFECVGSPIAGDSEKLEFGFS